MRISRIIEALKNGTQIGFAAIKKTEMTESKKGQRYKRQPF